MEMDFGVLEFCLRVMWYLPYLLSSTRSFAHADDFQSIAAGEEIRAKIVEGTAETVILMFECSVYQELYL
ncbi:unnamed protein product [Fusarium graminearum]|uniref:Chromosome 3, complete genome n=1 Tax=Gibberella zeae (strain ATCC MYA-4620 / CBS 123657 / FGSC 9075 / NRRL 31084 / PH-1) TaxID=229533 RepID=A0A098E4G7_GIBZE|nr:unnamed protein product [Fusarium graminearum]CAG1996694.1 unnamed protein product [Fusarium graminearum]CAG2006034.1 unnamed protein product [Fusarium graminearum]CEF88509.1 unnamed protein product [Fusarium graminearum]VTO81933.1 unnamed protein product [Fusarium graminearum]